MPVAPRKPCRTPGCNVLTHEAYCKAHKRLVEVVKREERIKYDNTRGTSASRGYTYRWTQFSRLFRQNNPLCEMCKDKGILKVAQCVDHIIAVDGIDDPLFYEESNLQSLCNTWHNLKSEAEGNRYNSKERFI